MMIFFLNLQPTSSHLHPLQVVNCDSNTIRGLKWLKMTMVNSDFKGLKLLLLHLLLLQVDYYYFMFLKIVFVITLIIRYC